MAQGQWRLHITKLRLHTKGGGGGASPYERAASRVFAAPRRRPSRAAPRQGRYAANLVEVGVRLRVRVRVRLRVRVRARARVRVRARARVKGRHAADLAAPAVQALARPAARARGRARPATRGPPPDSAAAARCTLAVWCARVRRRLGATRAAPRASSWFRGRGRFRVRDGVRVRVSVRVKG